MDYWDLLRIYGTKVAFCRDPDQVVRCRQKPALAQQFRRIADRRERQAGTLRDIQQECLRRIDSTPRGARKSPLQSPSPPVDRYRFRRPSCGSQYGFWLQYRRLFSSTSRMAAHDAKRFSQLQWLDEIEIVGRSVVFGKASPNASHQAADRKIEAGRAILALVVTVGENSRSRTIRCSGAGHGRGPVNLGISPAALLIVEAAGVSDAGQDQAMTDASGGLAVSREPGDGADGSGNEKKAIRIAKIASGKQLGQKRWPPLFRKDCRSPSDGWQAWHEIRTSSVERQVDSTRRRSGVRLREWNRCIPRIRHPRAPASGCGKDRIPNFPGSRRCGKESSRDAREA